MADDTGGLGAGTVGAVLVFGLTKAWEWWKVKKEREAAEQTGTRLEWRSEAESLRARNNELSDDLDGLRNEFHAERQETLKLQAAHQECLQREAGLKRQVEQIQASNDWMRGEITTLRQQVDELRRRQG